MVLHWQVSGGSCAIWSHRPLQNTAMLCCIVHVDICGSVGESVAFMFLTTCTTYDSPIESACTVLVFLPGCQAVITDAIVMSDTCDHAGEPTCDVELNTVALGEVCDC